MKKLFLFILLGMFIMSFASASTSEGLMSYWKFEESSGTLFDSQNNMNMLSHGTPLYNQQGEEGFSIAFDSNDDYFSQSSCPSNLDFQTTKDFSYSLWVNITDVTFGGDNKIFQSSSGQPFYALSVDISNKILGEVATAGGGNRLTLTGNNEINDSLFHNIIFIRNNTGQDYYLYIDGILEDLNLSTNIYNATCNTFKFGDSRTDRTTTGSIDEFRIYNRTLSESEIFVLSKTGLFSFINSPNSPSLTNKNINITSNTLINGTQLENITLSINGVINETKNISGIINESIFIGKLNNTGQYNISITTCNNESLCVSNENRTFLIQNYLEDNIVYPNSTISGNLETFTLQLNLSSGTTLTSSSFIFDGASYNPTITSLGSNRYNLTSQITIPVVTTTTNKTFYWNFDLSTGENANSTFTNTSVGLIGIDSCITSANKIFTFTMIDEDNLTELLTGNIDISLTVKNKDNGALVEQYNDSIIYSSSSKPSICINNLGSEDYVMDVLIHHYSDGYVNKYRQKQEESLNAGLLGQNITLYNLKNTTSQTFNIIVTGSTLSNGNRGLLVEAQRKYIASNNFNLVEGFQTDNQGQTLLHLVEEDEIYNFIISYNNVVLSSFNNYRVKCQNKFAGQCSIILSLSQSTANPINYESYGNVSLTYLFDVVNHILYETFTTSDANNHNVTQVVTQFIQSNTTLCTNSLIASSGTLTCTIPTVYQNTTFEVRTYSDGTLIDTKLFTQGENLNFQGADIFIELLMFSALVMLMLAHPILIILGSILGLIMPLILLYIGTGSFAEIMGIAMFYVVAGFVLMFVIRRKTV